MCGVIGVYGVENASTLAYHGLHRLQHRAKESAGIATYDGTSSHYRAGMGITLGVFDQFSLGELKGNVAIGHLRYSTKGTSDLIHAQPYTARLDGLSLAVAHNGEIRDAYRLRETYSKSKEGRLFQTNSDSEIILHTFARSSPTDSLEDRLIETFAPIQHGSYSVTMLINSTLVGARDIRGVRPLVLGEIKDGYVLASEDCAFDLMGANYIREIEPGEILLINEGGLKSIKPFEMKRKAHCVFELAYFSHPASSIFGLSTVEVREELGRQLARVSPVNADVVIPVPDSGNPAALGYAAELGIPFRLGLNRDHYSGRTFIEPEQELRELGVERKLSVTKSVVNGKRVVVVDDSIVRGTTSKRITRLLRENGARRIDWRIPFYPWKTRCVEGIDTATDGELAFNKYTSVEGIRENIGADSLEFLTIEQTLSAVETVARRRGVRLNTSDFCTACGIK